MEFDQDKSFDEFNELNPDDFQEEEEQEDKKDLKDAVLFVIELSKDLFQNSQNEKDKEYITVMDSIECFLKAKIINSPNDQIGIVFYNTDLSNIQDFKNQYLYMPLENPSAQGIRLVKQLQEVEEFKKTCGKLVFANKQSVPLRDVFWNAANQLRDLKREKFQRRIFLFTCNDNPHEFNPDAKRNAIFQAQNLLNMDIQIELFPLQKLVPEAKMFDITKFYSQIINFDISEVNEAITDYTSKIYDMKTRIRSKLFKKRSVNRIYWNLGNDVKVGVKLYSLHNLQKKPPLKQVYSIDTSKNIKRVTKYICKESGKQLQPSEVGHCAQLLKNLKKKEFMKVQLQKSELTEIKSLENIGMKLIGFKDSSFLENYYNYKQSLFIYPDNSIVKGSSQFFDALIKQMIEKDKVAIVKIIPRKGSYLRFGCLLPQKEEQTEDQTLPPGFHIIFLPYANDINHLSDDAKSGFTIISQEMIMMTKYLINMLTLEKFDFRNFDDPSLGKFYSVLEALALGEEQPDQVEDLLQPDYERIHQLEDVIQLYGECLKVESETNEDEYIVKTKPRKRKINEIDMNPKYDEQKVKEQLPSHKYLKQIFEEEKTRIQIETQKIEQDRFKQQQQQKLTNQFQQLNLKEQASVVSKQQFKEQPVKEIFVKKEYKALPQKLIPLQNPAQKPVINEKMELKKDLKKEEKQFIKSIHKKIIRGEVMNDIKLNLNQFCSYQKVVTDKEVIKYCSLTNQPI